MSDAPERIWLTADSPGHRPFVTKGPLAAPPRTEYARADLLRAAEAERDRLRDACQRIAQRWNPCLRIWEEGASESKIASYWSAEANRFQNIARAALLDGDGQGDE